MERNRAHRTEAADRTAKELGGRVGDRGRTELQPADCGRARGLLRSARHPRATALHSAGSESETEKESLLFDQSDAAVQAAETEASAGHGARSTVRRGSNRLRRERAHAFQTTHYHLRKVATKERTFRREDLPAAEFG